MPEKKVRIGSLKLRAAQVVESLPDIKKGSMIDTLDEYRDVEVIVSAIKKEQAIPQETWKVFALDEVKKKHPQLKGMKSLVATFAVKVRDLMKKQGVVDFVRLEKRNKKDYYLVGNTGKANG
jgi:hypothetical protein